MLRKTLTVMYSRYENNVEEGVLLLRLGLDAGFSTLPSAPEKATMMRNDHGSQQDWIFFYGSGGAS